MMFVIEAIYPNHYTDHGVANVVGLIDDFEDSVEWINEWLATQHFPQHGQPTLIKRYWFQDGRNVMGAYVFLVQRRDDGTMWVEE